MSINHSLFIQSNYLNCFICNETNKSIYAIFNKIFDDQLAAKFNYCGTAPKQPIKNTQTEKLIYCKYVFFCSKLFF